MKTPLDSYRDEFPEAEYDVEPKALLFLAALGFTDSSWHNDICPSFSHEAAHLVVWCDAPTESSRYSITRLDQDGQHVQEGEPQCFATFEELAVALNALMASA